MATDDEFLKTVDIKWILNHFDGMFNDNTFLNMYIDMKDYYIYSEFLRTVASTKYRWDWLNDKEKADLVKMIDRVLHL